MHLDDVPRGARDRRHDRRLAPGDPVQQCRLAGVRRTGNRHHQTVAQPLAARGARQRLGDFVAQLLRSIERRRNQILRHIGLVGKIDPRLDQGAAPRSAACARSRPDRRAGPSSAGTPGGAAPRVSAPIRSARPSTAVRSSLPFSNARRVNSPASAGRSPSIRDSAASTRGNHRAAAVQLQLGGVLAGLAVRPRKPQRQRFVDDLARRRIAQPRQRGLARGGQAAHQRLQRIARARPGDAHHGDRRRRAAGGEGEDGVGVGAHEPV